MSSSASRAAPEKSDDVGVLDKLQSTLARELNLDDGGNEDDAVREDRTIRNLLIGSAVLTAAMGASVFGYVRGSKTVVGVDYASAVERLRSSNVLSGGKYRHKPPWLVREHGKKNVTDEMIENDVSKRNLERRRLQERVDLERWKRVRLERLSEKEKRRTPSERAERGDALRDDRYRVAEREGLLDQATVDEIRKMFDSDDATEIMQWEGRRAMYFSKPFGNIYPNVSMEEPPYHSGWLTRARRSAMNVELGFEEMTQMLERLVGREDGDYYEILGVEAGAGEEEIKEAYRNEIKRWHPDTYRGSDPQHAARMFRLVRNAYEILTNKNSRLQYDERTARSPSAR